MGDVSQPFFCALPLPLSLSHSFPVFFPRVSSCWLLNAGSRWQTSNLQAVTLMDSETGEVDRLMDDKAAFGGEGGGGNKHFKVAFKLLQRHSRRPISIHDHYPCRHVQTTLTSRQYNGLDLRRRRADEAHIHDVERQAAIVTDRKKVKGA
ncbi:hypothetical protein LZ30DRAFT_713550 [Colletotrichum cereale]|nr:hypothetical protein LZ30DRAFT_713550 [Colletotrichum cereale]